MSHETRHYATDQVIVLIICLLYTSSILNINYGETLDVSCAIVCNVISLVFGDGATDSENVNLIRRSVPDGQITCSSKGISLTDI